MSVLSSVCALTSVARIVRLQRGLAEELYVYKYRSRLACSMKICTIRVTIEDIWKAFNKSQTDADAILVNLPGPLVQEARTILPSMRNGIPLASLESHVIDTFGRASWRIKASRVARVCNRQPATI